MSERNVELVRSLIPPPELDIAQLFRDEATFRAIVGGAGGALDPELRCRIVMPTDERSYHGLEGLRAAWLDWLEPWTAYHTHVECLEAVGDRVLVLVRDRARRAESDAEVEVPVAAVWTVRGGSVSQIDFYATREQAFEDIGRT